MRDAVQYLDTSIGAMAYRDAGAHAGAPVIMVHGWTGSSHNFISDMPIIADALRVIAPDLPGHGDSAKPIDREYTLDFMADALDEFFDALGIGEMYLMGHSMGGVVSAHYAITRPERVRRLVLASSAGLRGSISGFAALTRIDALGRVYVNWMAKNFARVMRANPSSYDPSIITDEMIEQRRKSFATPEARHATLSCLQNLITPHHLDRLLYKIPQPTLVLWGENDPVVSPHYARAFEAKIPDARLITFPQCGHLIGEEKAEDASRAMVKFLTG